MLASTTYWFWRRKSPLKQKKMKGCATSSQVRIEMSAAAAALPSLVWYHLSSYMDSLQILHISPSYSLSLSLSLSRSKMGSFCVFSLNHKQIAVLSYRASSSTSIYIIMVLLTMRYNIDPEKKAKDSDGVKQTGTKLALNDFQRFPLWRWSCWYIK